MNPILVATGRAVREAIVYGLRPAPVHRRRDGDAAA
jgi:hypothetical protein